MSETLTTAQNGSRGIGNDERQMWNEIILSIIETEIKT